MKGGDIDVFFRTKEQFDETKAYVESIGYQKHQENAYNKHPNPTEDFPGDLQLISLGYYATPEAVIDTFDFTICQMITDGDTLWLGDYTLWDLARKRLALHELTYPVATLGRLMKYSKQGFTVCDGVLADILLRTVHTPDLLDHLDVAYID